MSVKPNLPAKRGPSNAGQMTGEGGKEAFANPMEMVSKPIGGMASTKNDIGEMSGFVTDGYLNKKGTVYGEAAKLNDMPPGMDISNQPMADIRGMPMKRVVAESYPGDGWGGERDVAE